MEWGIAIDILAPYRPQTNGKGTFLSTAEDDLLRDTNFGFDRRNQMKNYYNTFTIIITKERIKELMVKNQLK